MRRRIKRWISVLSSAGLASIFANNAAAQAFTILHTFSGADGSAPIAGLVLSGNLLFGTTANGGANGSGTVFSIRTDGTGFTNLYNFTAAPALSNNDGGFPHAPLILSGDTLYGTTISGGTFKNGTVFKIHTDGSGFAVLHTFTATSNGSGYTNSDGAVPQGGVILSGGTLYGTTAQGGGAHTGTVFSLNADGTSFTTLYSFTAASPPQGANSDGAAPSAGLILLGETLFGTAVGGGSHGDGTLFSIGLDGSGFAVLHNFGPSDTFNNGNYPQSTLILSGNTFYGTTFEGGCELCDGSVFAMDTNGSEFSVLYGFPASFGPPTNRSGGANPSAGLVLSGNTLYGTASSGAMGYGTVFKMNTDGTGFAPLYAFTGGADGGMPQCGLVLSGNTLYGTASGQSIVSASIPGTVFSLSLPLPPTVTWTNPTPITYPTALNSNQLNAAANVPGSFAYNPPEGSVLGPGTNVLSLIFTPDDTQDYGNATRNVSLFVSLAPIALNVKLASNAVVLSWYDPQSVFVLQAASAATGIFTNIPGAASPFTNTITGEQQYFRLVAAMEPQP